MQNSNPRRGISFRDVLMSDITADSALDMAQTIIDDAGEGETVKARLRAAARNLGVPYGFVKRVRYREIKTIPAHVFLQLQDKYADVLERRERQLTAQLETYRNRLQTWKSSHAG